MSDTLDDTGRFVVPTGEAALVTNGPDDFTLLVPKGNEDSEVTRSTIYLTVCMIRFHNDPEFVEDMLQWFRDIPTN